MEVSREDLYAAVWLEPVQRVARRYSVSGSFLARVCTDLNVPRPERGHWAKLAAGKKVRQPPLPPARPGDYISWSPGGGLHRPDLTLEAPDPWTIRTTRKQKDRPAEHDLASRTADGFRKTWKDSETGHLRPKSRSLADIVVSKAQSHRAIALANELYLALEDRGHRVALGSGDRSDPLATDARADAYGSRQNWHPTQPTVVYIGTVNIGLSIFETTEMLPARYSFDHGGYVRTTSLKRPAWDHSVPPQHPFPTGKFAIRAFSASRGTTWTKQWTEATPGDLLRQLQAIIKEIEQAAPGIVPLIEAARQEQDRQRRKWEADSRRGKRKEALCRQREASEASLKELFQIISAWAEARNMENFFTDMEQRAQGLPLPDREQVALRSRAARELIGGVDSLKRFAAWRSPIDRLGINFTIPEADEAED